MKVKFPRKINSIINYSKRIHLDIIETEQTQDEITLKHDCATSNVRSSIQKSDKIAELSGTQIWLGTGSR